MRFRPLAEWRGVHIYGEPAVSNYPVALGVHVFFQEKPEKEYEENVEYLIRHYRGPVVLIDDEPTLNYLKQLLRALKPNAERYLIKTKPASVEMPSMSNERFARFLETFNSEILLFGGKHSLNGCLDSIEKILAEASLRTVVLKPLTFH